MKQIPKALVFLKNKSGNDWRHIRKFLIGVLDRLRVLQQSQIPPGDQKYYQMLWLKDSQRLIDENLFNKGELGDKQIKRYLQNLITAVYREGYQSNFMRYITDEEGVKICGGNKKYPNFV